MSLHLKLTNLLLLAALPTVLALPAHAQRDAQTKEQAVLIVDGNVREIFRSPRQTQEDYLVQIQVRRSELGRTPAQAVRVLAPAPGDDLYVHAFKGTAAARGGQGHRPLPAERSQVRVYLYPRPSGGWDVAYPEGFELTSDTLAPRAQDDPEPAASAPANAQPAPAPPRPLGIDAEPVKLGGQVAMKVTEVREGPARQAGIEVGDIIVAADNAPTTSADQLNAAVRKAGAVLTLSVRNVRTGRNVPVEVALGKPNLDPQAPSSSPKPSNPPAGKPGALGAVTVETTVNQIPAVKVTRVEPGSPADKAGLEPGDVITAVNDVVILSADQFDETIQKSGPTLTLTVVDVKSGKKTPVKVNLAVDR